jgi:trans-2,3-dihydro-3-hydroxyanthranilate isomerase
LAVLPHADGLSARDMQAVAREFNFAETTFVQQPSCRDYTARLRIFSPGMEMQFAGHPTVGSAAVLLARGLVAPDQRGSAHLVFEEGVGPVETQVVREHDRFYGTLVLSSPVVIDREGPPSRATLARVLNIDERAIIEVWEASVGIPFSFVRVVDRDVVDGATLNSTSWRDEFAGTWAEALFFFTGDTATPGEVYGRMFHPAAGIAEDPATGSAAAALVSSLYVRANRSGDYALLIKQGFKMGRPSHIHASVCSRGDSDSEVRVGGSVVAVAHGELQV